MLKYEQTTRAYDFSTAQKVVTGAASAQSGALASNEVLLSATANMYINIGSNPTAASTAGNLWLAAGAFFHLQVTPGVDKIAAIQDSAAGALFIIPVK